MINDVSRAYFYAPIQEGQYIYVKLPQEDILPGEEHVWQTELQYVWHQACRHKLANALHKGVSTKWIYNGPRK